MDTRSSRRQAEVLGLIWGDPTSCGTPQGIPLQACAFAVFLSLQIYSGLALFRASLGKGLRPGEGGGQPGGSREQAGSG